MTLDNLVSKFPVVTSFLLEGANFGQIVRMWTERTALGQSLTSWIMVNIALWLWFVFFKIKTPQEHLAIWMSGIGIAINAMVVLSVVWFRYIQ